LIDFNYLTESGKFWWRV